MIVKILKCLFFVVFVNAFVAQAGTLHSDVFGNVYDGDSPFPVGKIDNHGQSGDLRTDAFGNVYVGNSAFSSGRVKTSPSAEGKLHRDTFGNVRSGSSPFDVDTEGVIKKKR